MSLVQKLINKRNKTSKDSRSGKSNYKKYFINKKDVLGLDLFLAGLRSFLFFAKMIYNFEQELPEHSYSMFKIINKYNKVIIKAARGHLKSTTLQLYAVWVTIYAHEYMKKNNIKGKTLRILQLSYSGGQAYDWHKEFQGYLIDAIIALQLPVDIKRMTRNSGRTRIGNVEIISAGITGALRGKHPHIILCDDLLTDKNYISQEMMQTIFYQGIIGMTMPITKVIVVGTPLRFNDLLAELSELEANISKIKRVVEGYPISLKGYVYIMYAAIKEDGTALWSERPKKWLDEKLLEMGLTRFTREFLCLPMSIESALFRMDMLNRCDRPEYSWQEVSGGRLFVGVDLANSIEQGSSFSSFILMEEIGGKKSGTLVFRDHWYKRSNKNVEKLKAIYKFQALYGQITLVNVEKNAYQGSFVDLIENDVLRISISEEFWKEGVLDNGVYLRRLIVEGDQTGGEKHSENIGIPGLQGMFETQNLLFPIKTEADVRMSQIIKDDFAPWILDPSTDKYKSLGSNDDISMSVFIGIKGYRGKKKKGGFSIKDAS